MKPAITALAIIFMLAVCATASARRVSDLRMDRALLEMMETDSISPENPVDTIVIPTPADDSLVLVDRWFAPIQSGFYGPAVFDHYRFNTPLAIPRVNRTGSINAAATQWIDDELFREELLRDVKQGYMVAHPELVNWNMAQLPVPPPAYQPVVDPRQHKFHIASISSAEASKGVEVPVEIDRKNWINTFEAALQFSESYLSPNWYQGGDGVSNALGNVMWTNRLNQAFHPKLLFETSVQYKLAMNTAPDDSVHTYNISEDVFRINSKFGFKAFKRWFYSVTFQFKTQLLNNYKKNTDTMLASFLSPGELNVGLGLTYTFVNPKETLNFTASISPIAYNLKTCSNKRVDPTTLGIDPGKTSKSEIGTNLECKLAWNLCKNVTWTSRLFAFTDYTYLQGDWENTFNFEINRFLSTQLFVHLRYDSSTTPSQEAKWRYWQLKEILSIGFSYKFSSLGAQ